MIFQSAHDVEMPHGLLIIRDRDSHSLPPDDFLREQPWYVSQSEVLVLVIHEQFGVLSLITQHFLANDPEFIGSPYRSGDIEMLRPVVNHVLEVPSSVLVVENTNGDAIETLDIGPNTSVRVEVFLTDDIEGSQAAWLFVVSETPPSSP